MRARGALTPAESAAEESSGLLWSIVLEHLDEAEFAMERLDAALVAPEYTLDEVARGPEERFLAHVDALVVSGPAVVDGLLAPALQAETPLPLARGVAIVVALIAAGRWDIAAQALTSPSADVRRAAVRGCALAGDTSLDAWVVQTLSTPLESQVRAGVLELAADRGLSIASAGHSLRSECAEEIVAALRVVRRAEPVEHEARILELLEHPHPSVRDAALVTSLHHGSWQGWAACKKLALDPAAPHPLAMTLLAGLGDSGHHRELAGLLDSDAHRPGALRALGFSGNVEAVPTLLFHAGSKEDATAKLAGEAIATIVGDEVNRMIQRPAPAATVDEDAEAKRSLPPFEEDDLDAELAPGPEGRLPRFDVGALGAWWTEAQGRFDVRRRYLGGAVVTRAAFARALAGFPMRRRYLLGLLLSVRTAGSAGVSARALPREQRGSIEGLSLDASELWARRFAAFG